jgi:hypothetical protein
MPHSGSKAAAGDAPRRPSHRGPELRRLLDVRGLVQSLLRNCNDRGRLSTRIRDRPVRLLRYGSELFGDATSTLSGQRAANGFEALRELDVNNDSRVDSTDASWNALLLWTDTNHDGTSQAGELTPLAGSSLVALDTSYRWVGRRDSHGNLYRFQGRGHLHHGTRVIYDVYFRTAE